jgi:hypothetical protein
MKLLLPLVLAMTLAACGGGDANPEVDQEYALRNRLLNENTLLYEQLEDITDPAVRAPLVTQFNTNASTVVGLRFGANAPHCGTQKGREEAFATCMGVWNRATRPLT